MITPPDFLRRLGSLLPPALPSIPFVLGLELARRRHWLTPPEELNGRRFGLTISDLGLHFIFTCERGQFRPLFAGTGELELSASLADFIALLRGSADADTLFFQRRMQIHGDTELGLIVKNWLDAADRPAWLQRLAAPTA